MTSCRKWKDCFVSVETQIANIYQKTILVITFFNGVITELQQQSWYSAHFTMQWLFGPKKAIRWTLMLFIEVKGFVPSHVLFVFRPAGKIWLVLSRPLVNPPEEKPRGSSWPPKLPGKVRHPPVEWRSPTDTGKATHVPKGSGFSCCFKCIKTNKQ